ncbi:MAG: NAD(P)H-hydrate dehydratase [Emcibacter sp.]|nr:NAD(P)H-hydrate dehydratase [Emcibacter sp.]
MNVLLTTTEMMRADQITIQSGIMGADLMEAAGLAVTRHIMNHYPQVKTLILCGPGNNGGDGFVVARHLKHCGWQVELMLWGARDRLVGDAAFMAHQWDGDILPFTSDIDPDYGLVVDALLGAGLSRPLKGEIATVIERINALSDVKVVAVDMPSGVDGNNGQIRGTAIKANSTVTFFRKKPGHLLYPGRELCGDVAVCDIGISERVLDTIKAEIFGNDPSLWMNVFPQLNVCDHKYNRGHGVVISGGAAQSGAARLAAKAALRIGAGLVSVACPEDAVFAHAAQLTSVMIKPLSKTGDIDHLLADEKINSWCIGPNCGVTDQTRHQVLKILKARRHCVIDADALRVFAKQPEILWDAISTSGRIPILTPHAGEFSHLFSHIAQKTVDKLSSARMAAEESGAVIIYKGPDTVIASPDGRTVINDNAPPQLATAGSGDVLSGLCMGLMAQNMPPFEAACAAVWIHAAAANAFGQGLISEDIEGQIPRVLRQLPQNTTQNR